MIGPQPGTCHWIERHDVFRNQWVEASESKLLLITGPPGCGKSCLTKHIRQQLSDEFADPNLVLAFFCNNTRVHQNESPILQHFVSDLLQKNPALFHQIPARFRTLKPEAENMRLGILMEILKAILRLKQERKIFLLIDGMDECDPVYTEKMMKLFYWMFHEYGPDSVRATNVARIAILGRRSPEISKWTGSHLHIDITSDHVSDDIAELVEDKFHHMDAQRFYPQELDDVKNMVLDRAGSNFLWVDNVIKDLDELWDTSQESLEGLIDKCPHDMEVYYEEILKDVEALGSELISCVLDLVLWTRRPLDIAELCAAVNIALDGNLTDFQLSSMLRKNCARLLRINNDDEVAFVHHSLREMLTRIRAEDVGHCKIVRISLQGIFQVGRELGLNSCDSEIPALESLTVPAFKRSHPFLHYISQELFEHARLAGNELISIFTTVNTFLGGDARYY